MSQEKQPSAETTSPVSFSHERARELLCTADRLAQERRQFVVDKAARETKRFAQDLETMAAGEKAAEYLVDGSPADMIPEEVVPLLNGAVVAVDETIDKARILEQRTVTLCRRRDDGLTDDEFCQAVVKAYQQSPAMRRVKEVVHQITSGVEDLHAGNPTISIGVFDPSIYIDRVLMRRVQQDGGNSALQCYGTALLARYEEQNDTDKHLYLHTASARALLDACDAGGVRLAGTAEWELITEQGSRYGNAYAWMSREIIKMAADQTGHLVADDEHHAVLQPTGEPAADVLVALLNQITTRGTDRTSDLPMPTEAVRLREGGCKDVEAYFAQAYMMSTRSVMSETAIADKRFISKTHGAQTFLAADAVRYCGVEFPPGTVWGQFGDGYAPLRLTGFCFDQNTAATVFGAEYMANVLEANQRAVHNYFRHIVQS
ncbi:MAG: hypothetical protein D8B38_05685 [Candidatus Saccharimonas sp.]|nr:MAG: hypothetical protein D8B38_05685 [Candidatus Saccharimonas sp.]